VGTAAVRELAEGSVEAFSCAVGLGRLEIRNQAVECGPAGAHQYASPLLQALVHP
jgi:hypothetical protein